MLIIVRIFGTLVVVLGIIMVFNPDFMRQFMRFLKQGNRIYGIGVFRILFGILFLLAASEARLVGVMIALGILALIGGTLIFLLGRDKVRSILDWWDRRPQLVLRLWGLLAVAIGSLIIYSA